MDFEHIVRAYYELLYRFALNMTADPALAGDLTQQTFYTWARKGHTLRDPAKVKSWLTTILYREFLRQKRHANRYADTEIGNLEDELPVSESSPADQMDADLIVSALGEIDEIYRVPLSLFYLEEYSYKEIAELLKIPPGTVMSRLARGKELLRDRLTGVLKTSNIIPLPGKPLQARKSYGQ